MPNQVAVYSAGSPLVWREVEGGELPSPRYGLRATVVGDNLFLSGGWTGRSEGSSIVGHFLTTVISWNPAVQVWQEVGNLAVARDQHATVAVPNALFIQCK